MDLKDYLNLPYTRTFRRDEEGDFVARVQELPGCVAHGSTPVEALEALDEAFTMWVQDAIAAGHPVPDPAPDEDTLPSGKWVQRVPRRLHQSLVQLAKIEGVSLNQLVTSLVAEAVGRRASRRDPVVRDVQVKDAASTGVPCIVFETHIPFKEPWPVHASQPEWSLTGKAVANPYSILYLDSLSTQLPDHCEIVGEDYFHAHPRVPLSGVSKPHTAVRSWTRLVHRKT